MVGREGLGIHNLESPKKKVVGEPYEGKPHVRFEVAGDGNQDMVWVIEALSKETESKQAAHPKSQAPFPDPTCVLKSHRLLIGESPVLVTVRRQGSMYPVLPGELE